MIRRLVLLAVMLLAAPLALYAHVTLSSSAPARDEELRQAPGDLRLRFSGRIEARYTSVTLTAPDGTQVPLGALSFLDDREFTAAMPPVSQPGVYVVRWRTAGADGHVLEGSYSWTLLAAHAGADSGSAAPVAPPPGAPVGAPAQDAHDHGSAHEVPTGVQPMPVLGRWLHFLSLTLLLGALSFRMLLWPRLRVSGPAALQMKRHSWYAVSAAALLLACSAVLRLWLQSRALHGAELAWDSALLTLLLTDTAWGRAWVVQTFFFALLGAGILAATRASDRIGLNIAVIAGVGLAVVPALSGHAAGAGGLGRIAIVVDALHVVAVGAWLGTLALMLAVMVPAMVRHERQPTSAVADGVVLFSPMALVAASLVVATGLVNSLMHIGALAQLWETSYGRALLIKLALVACVAAAGFWNWRFVRPRLATDPSPRRLRISAALELGAAALVLLATAVLTGLPRP